ncbi:hypothetical protein SAMN04515620_11989 [Collimonas sp. OK607]|nr:hypothetical protein SAMN04515620_11989 [Collimonas sp. OK607]
MQGFSYSNNNLVQPAAGAARQILLSSQRFQSSVQTALMACSLVLVNDFLVRDTVDNRYGFLQNQRCSSFVATSIDCLASSFDSCTQGRTLTGVVQVLLNCLTSTLTCLCGICHLYFLKRGRECLRGINKPDRDAEFCKATDYNQFFSNRQTPLALETILSQESTVAMMQPTFLVYRTCCGNNPAQTLSQSTDCADSKQTLANAAKINLIFQILRKLRQAICYSYNAAP